jgi:voltage-gated potassium channel
VRGLAQGCAAESILRHFSIIMTTPTPADAGPARAAIEPYDLYMLGISTFAIGILAADALVPLTSPTHHVLEYADTALCLLFLIDFARNLKRAPNRTRYFVRGGWLDLISSVPTIGILRLARVVRIARVVRLLRAMRSVRSIGQIIMRHRRQSALLAATTVSGLLLTFASVAVLQFERQSDANIKSAGDAIWWAFATITTVGYGDRYPVTFEGRMVAAVLMIAGVGLFGAMSGFVGSWFLQGDDNRQEEDAIEGLRLEVARLATLIEHPRGQQSSQAN